MNTGTGMLENDTDAANPFTELSPAMGNTPIAPAHGIAAIALTMALKYHDINTVQDGLLYQQYKLEGKNFQTLHLDMIFETAIQMELHLLGSSKRMAKLLIDAIEFHTADDPTAEETPEAKATP